jgi:hypothetical protein
MVKKWFNRSGAGAASKLDWQQIVHPSPPGKGLTQPTASPSSEEDWLQAAVPQSLVNDGETAIPGEYASGEYAFDAAGYSAPVSPSPPIAAPTSSGQRRTAHRASSWSWSLLLLAMGICGGVGAIALLRLTTLPPPPDCQNITPLTADVERLYCAEQAARSGQISQLAAGLKLVGEWTPDHPLYREAQNLMKSWSGTLISIARTAYNQGNIRKASEVISSIPPSSPLYGDAQKTRATWQQQWRQGQQIYNAAQTALKQQQWDQASAQVPALAQVGSLYWRRDQLNQLTHQIFVEKQAWQQLLAARKLSDDAQPIALGSAMTAATQIDANTYTWALAKVDLDRWSKTLMAIGLKRWQQGDRAGAIAAMQQFPKDFHTVPQVKDMLQFGQAIDLAAQARSQWQPSISQLASLMEALAAIRQIPSSSLFHAEAQTALKDWQQQLEDITQLQFATLTAGLGQKASFQVAIQQAQQIGATQPRRVQAQTLIAHWGREIERIEDRPYILQAKQMAVTGTIPALRSAIAEASQVRLGRALRLDAQTYIAQWNNQIEVIEDQPILDEARSIAQRGRLGQAIAVASRIGFDRALYREARSAIRGWQAEIRRIQIAQDQQILEEARSLAAVESLTLAIEKAAEIAPGRILYGEAQAEIANWQIRRQEIWDSWATEPAPPDDSYDNNDGADSGEDSGAAEEYDQSY